MAKYYVGDVGTLVLVDVKSDITTGTVFKMKILKPLGGEAEWTATREGQTRMKYNIVAGDWDEPGHYKLQAYVETPSWIGRGDTVSFFVSQKFE